MKLKPLKIGLFVLIAFGMIKYRKFFIDSIVKIGENLAIFPLVFIIGSIGVLMAFMRWVFFVRTLEYKMGLWNEFKVYFSGFATIPSLVKFSDSLRLVYMKKYGMSLADSVSVYGMERIMDMVVTSIIFLIFVGQITNVAGILGVLALGYLALKMRRFWLAKITKFERFKRLEEYIESTVYNLKKFIRPVPLLATILFSLGMYVFQLFAFSIAAGVEVWELIPAYLLGWILITTTPTPAGLGFYEAAVSAAIAGMVGASNALATVLIFRFVVLWIPIMLGQASVALMSH